MTRFEGFADDKASFFKALAKHNDRDWFAKHKTELEEGWRGPFELLLQEVSAGIDAAYPYCELDAPKIFRLNRDVRFSKDKSPYKTQMGGLIPIRRSNKKVTDLPMALYFHVGAEESFAACGHYMMEADSLARFRKAVAEDVRGKELDKVLARLAKKGFTPYSHDALKRVPKGFDPKHPRADLLKRKGLIARFPALPKGILASRELLPWLITGCKATAPFVSWLAFA